MYYDGLYGKNNAKLNERLFDVNKQISSGLKIQYAKDDIAVFTKTMHLDNEISALAQVKKSTENGSKITDQTDNVLNEFGITLDRVKTLLIQASNSSSSESSLDAISAELRGLEEHLMSLANTSIGGQYLFSGSAISTKPINDDGIYMGNDAPMNSILGSGVLQQHNLTGQEFFLGEELGINRKVITNIPQYNLSAKYPDFTDPTNVEEDKIITTSDTIRSLMGDTDEDLTNSNGSHFYLSGTKSDGTSFTKHIKMSNNEKVDSLLTQIGNAFGNTPAIDVVNVTMNQYGEIVVEDKVRGSSKLDFHMVGATDYDKTDGKDAADIYSDIYNNATDNRGLISNLSDGETNFDLIINGVSKAANTNLYVKSFVKSSYNATVTPNIEMKSAQYTMTGTVDAADIYDITIDNGDGTTTFYDDRTLAQLKSDLEATGDSTVDVGVNSDSIKLNSTAQGVAKGVSIDTSLTSSDAGITITETIVNSEIAADIDAILYDRTQFSKNGAKLTSSTPHVLKSTNAFITPSTKIFEVADLSKGGVSLSLDGTKFDLNGIDVNGNVYTAKINLDSAGSTFSIDTDADGVVDTDYNIYNTNNPRAAVDADEMTYQQLMDVVNIIVTGTPLPAAPGTDVEYDNMLSSSKFIGGTTITYDGKIQFEDLNSTNTNATISLYDSNAENFGTDASVINFNSNNALSIRDPKTDFFKTIDDIITAVEEHKLAADSSSGTKRSVGIEDGIAMIDDLQDHLFVSHAIVGAQSNILNTATERAQTLEISTITLRSSVIDTDLAEASLTLQQLTVNYQAMLSTVGKVSQLSLVNYL